MSALRWIAMLSVLAVGPSYAADFEQQWTEAAGIHRGGYASLHLGYLFFDPDNNDSGLDQRATAGGSFAYSMPLSEDVSFQLDGFGEAALQWDGDNDQTLFEGMFGGHLSKRDPERHLMGLFGGAGLSVDGGDDGAAIPFLFAGVEGQAYFARGTLTGQAGWLDGNDNELETIENALFVRGVASHYVTDQTRLSGELSYLHGGRPNNDPTSGGVIDIYGWGASLDHVFPDHSFAVGLVYNGYDFQPTEESDAPWVHEFRVRLTKYFGSPSILENDRRAAGLDLPPISRWISTATNEIE